MSKNEISDNLITHYLVPKKEKRISLSSMYTNKSAGQSLNEFYNEMQSRKNSFDLENIYYGKNAREIEVIMIQNRKQIEANYTK